MPLLPDITALKAELGPPRRLLGMDVGEKTIGLALSDLGLMIATPRDTLRRRKFRDDAAALVAVIGEANIGALVVGLPLNMDGSEGPRSQSTRQFVRNLEAHIDLPVLLWDERLSTAAVERELIGLDFSRARRAEVIDAHAAAYILQGALDRLRDEGAAGQK